MEIDRAPGFPQIDIKHSMLDTQRALISTGTSPLEAARERTLRYHALRKSQARSGDESGRFECCFLRFPHGSLKERAPGFVDLGF